jgi:hypothetical protein
MSVILYGPSLALSQVTGLDSKKRLLVYYETQIYFSKFGLQSFHVELSVHFIPVLYVLYCIYADIFEVEHFFFQRVV